MPEHGLCPDCGLPAHEPSPPARQWESYIAPTRSNLVDYTSTSLADNIKAMKEQIDRLRLFENMTARIRDLEAEVTDLKFLLDEAREMNRVIRMQSS